ncbi:DUF6969 family protein [Acidocella sp.]|uniref:DUF6969 family protein n=1 Tax=Acidocella sp. TaxID=50710 RepID=UPI001857DA03|nr:hypothetical protein [Acidocella sp.]NNM56819.1 hypothetical protein [Acidocella sp.]
MRAKPTLFERAEAAATLVAALGEMESAGQNIVTTLLNGQAFVTETHYPADDALDPHTRAQYYFHAHRGAAESGHIHCFLRGEDKTGLTHVLAIALDHDGRPAQFFTTNLWVTADNWLPAEALIPQLPRLAWPDAPAPAPVNQALTALCGLYRREIAALLRRRDKRLARHAAASQAEALADETLEILSRARIDLPRTLVRLRQSLKLPEADDAA